MPNVLFQISLSDFQASIDRIDSGDLELDSSASGSSVNPTVIESFSPSERLVSTDEEKKDEFYFVRANAEQLPQVH